MAEDQGLDAPVFVIIEMVKVTDSQGLGRYQLGAREQIAQRGGVMVARGGAPLEGAPAFGPLLIQKWPSEAAFVNWQASTEYQPLRSLRMACAEMRFAIVPLASQGL